MHTETWSGKCCLAVAAVLSLLVTRPVSATVVIALDQHQLISSSDFIITGQVVQQRSFWQNGSIWTETKIAVQQRLKGRLSDKLLVLKQLGGKVDDMRQLIAGRAAFVSGEKVLLFLEKHPTKTVVVTGMAQGKFTVTIDPTTKRAIATRELGNLTLVKRLQSGGLTVVSPLVVKPYFFLDELLKAIQQQATTK